MEGMGEVAVLYASCLCWGDGPWTPLHAGEAGGRGEKRELREGGEEVDGPEARKEGPVKSVKPKGRQGSSGRTCFVVNLI